MCQLEHRSVSSGSFCGPESLFTADGGDGFGTDGPSFISTLYATASPRLNGMLVECFGPDGVNLEPYNLVGSGTVKIIGKLNNNFSLTNQKKERFTCDTCHHDVSGSFCIPEFSSGCLVKLCVRL